MTANSKHFEEYKLNLGFISEIAEFNLRPSGACSSK